MFWGVRALKKDGEEVGIDAGDGNYLSPSKYLNDIYDEDLDYGFGGSEEEDG